MWLAFVALEHYNKLTLEKAISMARASEASKEQIKAMGTKEQKDKNPSVNEIRADGTTGGDKQKQNPSRRPRPGAATSCKNVETLSQKHNLSCFKSLLVTGL